MLPSSLPIICLALALAVGSTTQAGKEVSHLPSFSNILVNRAIREDVLRSGVLNSSTIAYLSGLPESALTSVPDTTRVVSGIYEVIFREGGYGDPFTVSEMVCPERSRRPAAFGQYVSVYIFPECLSRFKLQLSGLRGAPTEPQVFTIRRSSSIEESYDLLLAGAGAEASQRGSPADIIVKSLCKMVQEDVQLGEKDGVNFHHHGQGTRVLQRSGDWKTIPFVEAQKMIDTSVSATVLMASLTLPTHPKKFNLPNANDLRVKVVVDEDMLYKISHNGDSIQFKVEDNFLRLKSYKCSPDGLDGLKTPAQKMFGVRGGPLIFDTRWLPFESLSKVGYTGFRLPPSLASSTDVVTKLTYYTMHLLVTFWRRSLFLIVLPALALALKSSTQSVEDEAKQPSFSPVLVNRTIRDDVLRSGVLNSSTVAFLSGLKESDLKIPNTTRVVSGIYQVIFEHGEYADPLTVSEMVCPDANPRTMAFEPRVTAYLFPEGLSSLATLWAGEFQLFHVTCCRLHVDVRFKLQLSGLRDAPVDAKVFTIRRSSSIEESFRLLVAGANMTSLGTQANTPADIIVNSLCRMVTEDMVSWALPSHSGQSTLPAPGNLKVKAVIGDDTVYKVSHNGDSIRFRVEDNFLRLKSYKCPTDGPDGLKTPAQEEFAFRDGPLLFETRWLPFESLSKVGYTGFRLPPSLASSIDVVTKYIQWLYYGVSLNALQGLHERNAETQRYLTEANDPNQLFIRNVCYFQRLGGERLGRLHVKTYFNRLSPAEPAETARVLRVIYEDFDDIVRSTTSAARLLPLISSLCAVLARVMMNPTLGRKSDLSAMWLLETLSNVDPEGRLGEFMMNQRLTLKNDGASLKPASFNRAMSMDDLRRQWFHIAERTALRHLPRDFDLVASDAYAYVAMSAAEGQVEYLPPGLVSLAGFQQHCEVNVYLAPWVYHDLFTPDRAIASMRILAVAMEEHICQKQRHHDIVTCRFPKPFLERAGEALVEDLPRSVSMYYDSISKEDTETMVKFTGRLVRYLSCHEKPVRRGEQGMNRMKAAVALRELRFGSREAFAENIRKLYDACFDVKDMTALRLTLVRCGLEQAFRAVRTLGTDQNINLLRQACDLLHYSPPMVSRPQPRVPPRAPPQKPPEIRTSPRSTAAPAEEVFTPSEGEEVSPVMAEEPSAPPLKGKPGSTLDLLPEAYRSMASTTVPPTTDRLRTDTPASYDEEGVASPQRKAGGMVNTGTLCYANATLQVLSRLPGILDDIGRGPITKAFSEIVSDLTASEPRVVNAEGLLKMLGLPLDQEMDASEFLLKLLDGLSRENDGKGSSLEQMMCGETKCTTQVDCPDFTCSHSTLVSSDAFTALPVPMCDCGDLRSALTEMFGKPSIVDGEVKCGCGRATRNGTAIRRSWLESEKLPPVLVFVLQRFAEDGRKKTTGKFLYCQDLNARPFTENRIGSPILYELVGVVCHEGQSCDLGHYVSYVRSSGSLEDRFVSFDDTTVHIGLRFGPIVWETAASVYMLVYKRRASYGMDEGDAEGKKEKEYDSREYHSAAASGAK
ncbi:ubiquitin-specific protease ubp15 [Perkinsus olseni]|uniref:Ubiquitin-specific protease ubp15 n=1 Tax=Perkinsus olseni TaxID=32597 RepID=A0A7J6ME15_PEROL|nr:ubiquitin-specific protease ubp15 [Perkinsus olseni]